MRVISSIMGVAAVKASNDDTGPLRGILQRDLAEFVGNHYRFNVKPVIGPGLPAAMVPVLQFQSGEFVSEDGKTPIIQIIITLDGDAAIAHDTDAADAVLTDYMMQLDTELGFRFSDADLTRMYSSHLVAEFDSAFVDKTLAFVAIENVLNEEIVSANRQYKLKRLGFGVDSITEVPLLQTIDQLVPMDFLIERRVNEPLAKNRFHCRAPLTTAEHSRVLAMVERAVIG